MHTDAGRNIFKQGLVVEGVSAIYRVLHIFFFTNIQGSLEKVLQRFLFVVVSEPSVDMNGALGP